MLDSRTRRHSRLAAWSIAGVALLWTPGRAGAQSPHAGSPPGPPVAPPAGRAGDLVPAGGDAPSSPPPFAVPKDRAEWDARRPAVYDRLGGAFRAEHPGVMKYTASLGPAETPAALPGAIVEPIHLYPRRATNPGYDGLYLRRDRPGATDPIPLVVLVVDPRPAGTLATAPGWDGRPPAAVLLEMGFAVLVFDHPQFGSPFMGEFALQGALDGVIGRPEVDRSRVAVVGLGRTGITALRLMAMDPRVTCGVAAIHGRDARATMSAGAGAAVTTVTTNVDEFAALCAPRPLCLMVGEPLPLAPPGRSVGKLLERAAKGTYKVYGKEGTGLTFSLFGMFPGHDSVGTRLQWMAALEHLDKHFRPQKPTPLPHPAEPEPTFDPGDKEVLNLTERGIAGWAPEMAGRESTWTWQDGVVFCRPQALEYGWLRCPVEVADFQLQVEWNVPARGNAGIFLRARPVDWTLPPTEENRLRVMTLGLTWPSRTGLELQTQDDPGHADRYSTGSLYRHAAPASNPTRSPDEWNRSTVRARGTRVEVWNNGVQVLDADLARATDTLPVPPLRGYIGLQNHGAPARYRNVRLRRLASDQGGEDGRTGSPGPMDDGKASR